MSVLKCLAWTTRLDKILDQVQPGDLVRFHRGLFIHHAVFVGRGRAVHHHLGPSDGEVIEATMEYLAKGDLMKVVKVADTGTPFSPREIVCRARSQLGPRPYSLHDGNCEHFTTWVYHDVRESSQLSGLCQYEIRLLQIVRHRRRSVGQDQQPQPQQPQLQQPQLQQPQLQEPQHQQSQHQQSQPQQSQPQQPQIQQSQSQQPQQQPPLQSQQQPLILEQHNHQRIEDADSDAADDSFVFVPPRPIKYRHTKNPARIAGNHARSCLKVLTIQSILGLAAVPLYRCSLQADNLQKLGRQLTGQRRRKKQQNQQQQEGPLKDAHTANNNNNNSSSD